MTPRAAVTGGTGLIGSRIVERLVAKRFDVRVLTRGAAPAPASSVEMVRGDLSDRKELKSLLSGVEYVFHCAAETGDEALMEATNVEGTRSIVSVSADAGVRVFCHLSSVGVIGPTGSPVVDETTPCTPRNRYETTKLRAEEIVAGHAEARTIILRPANVVAETRLGVLEFLKLRSARDYLKLFLKGRERAHIVHVDDVAASALHLALSGATGRYVVSTDDEEGGSYGEILATARGAHPFPYCPAPVAELAATMLHGHASESSIRYTSRRLRETGFRFEVGLGETVRRLSRALQRS
jgi:nucleoside-diphosphate-sugar epimerase